MKALIVAGSMNADGITARMCGYAADALRGLGWEARIVFPSGMDIRHCSGCGKCASGVCAIDDDMAEILDAVEGSDLLILASPIHFSGPSSLIKTVMDRFQPYWWKGSHGGRMAAMLCGGSPNARFSCAVAEMRALSITAGMGWAGHLEFPGTDDRGGKGLKEAVGDFVCDIVTERRGISCSRRKPARRRIWPPGTGLRMGTCPLWIPIVCPSGTCPSRPRIS
ncbi:MAG: flavodoxin family protein [Candidatus Methanomethylophilaceae archaeon]|nr:flavodoxin family protein [Candidatus Methanomethylophilaceae archaeon]